MYDCVFANEFSSKTSSVATLTVISDTVAPVALSAVGSANRGGASVVFSEPMLLPSATNGANYMITNAAGAMLAVTAVILSPDGFVATLTTDAQTSGAPYWVKINNLAE